MPISSSFLIRRLRAEKTLSPQRRCARGPVIEATQEDDGMEDDVDSDVDMELSH
ncbi:hypothetical protein B0H10DRAFT_2240385 [Mycena sp. CBHHK59/15]|nr:hypothetical protein B0H10DRAFT_2240385 [Mycena sp. CBHHK59/15]